MSHFASILLALLLAIPAMSVELFRYRGAAKGGGTLEFVFEADEQTSSNAVTKEKVAEIAADFMTTFYHVQIGALETQEFRKTRKESLTNQNASDPVVIEPRPKGMPMGRCPALAYHATHRFLVSASGPSSRFVIKKRASISLD